MASSEPSDASKAQPPSYEMSQQQGLKVSWHLLYRSFQ